MMKQEIGEKREENQNKENKVQKHVGHLSLTMHNSIVIESHSLQLQVERVLSICRRLDPGSLFLRNKSY